MCLNIQKEDVEIQDLTPKSRMERIDVGEFERLSGGGVR